MCKICYEAEEVMSGTVCCGMKKVSLLLTSTQIYWGDYTSVNIAKLTKHIEQTTIFKNTLDRY